MSTEQTYIMVKVSFGQLHDLDLEPLLIRYLGR